MANLNLPLLILMYQILCPSAIIVSKRTKPFGAAPRTAHWRGALAPQERRRRKEMDAPRVSDRKGNQIVGGLHPGRGLLEAGQGNGLLGSPTLLSKIMCERLIPRRPWCRQRGVNLSHIYFGHQSRWSAYSTVKTNESGFCIFGAFLALVSSP